MSHDGMVIIGAGHAGARAAQSLRASGWDGSITVVDGEHHQPYERPPLSKAVLSGTAESESALLFPNDFLQQNGIDHLSDVHAVALDRSNRKVQLSSGETLGYERLLLATGAAPRQLDVPGKDLAGSYFLRTAADAEQLSQQLSPGAEIAIIGGGLIGLEVAASAVHRDCHVTVIEAGPRLMMRAVPPELSEQIRRFHEEQGVRFLLGRQVTAMQGTDRLESLQLDDGSVVSCSAVLISIGVTPRVDLASSAGLEIDNGIAVNRYLQTSDPYIYAAGDACAFEQLDSPRVRMESWKNAEDQGALVGRNMAGAEEPYIPAPWIWSDQYDRTMQIAGCPEDGEHHIQRICADGSLLIYHLRADNGIAGVSGFGSIREVARGVRVGQMLMQKDIRPDTKTIEDPTSDLKAFAKAASA